ncbi:MAG: DUF3658 domain-containing protein [Sedimentibacter sp.]
MQNDKRQQYSEEEITRQHYLKTSPFNTINSNFKYTACVGTNGGYDQSTIYEGFKDAVDTLIKSIGEYSNFSDPLVYPILFCIRHSIELFLKDLYNSIQYIKCAKDNRNSFIRLNKARRIQSRLSQQYDDCDCIISNNYENDSNAHIEKNKKRREMLQKRLTSIQSCIDTLSEECFKDFKEVKFTHNLNELIQKITSIYHHIDIRIKELCDDVLPLLSYYKDIDPNGDAFRYWSDKDGKPHFETKKINIVKIDIIAVQFEEIKKLFGRIDWLMWYLTKEYNTSNLMGLLTYYCFCYNEIKIILYMLGGEIMLEVVFNDSEKGSMKIAKNYNEKNMLNGAVSYSYIGKKPTKSELKKHFEGQAVGGNSKDVVNIGFSLDVGEISGEIDGNERQNVFRKLWGRFNLDNKEQERFFLNQRKDMEQLLSAAKDGIPIRIWKSNAPYSTCGFYFVSDMLRNIDCDISVVSLPEYKQISENEIVEYSHWGEVDAGKFYQFLPLEKQLSQIEKRIIGDYWHELVEENTPLRAIINGKLISVQENFYDFIITKNLPDDDFLMARLIGKLIGEYRLGITDSWYALRIDKMIEANKLIVVENKDPSHPYGKILRKNMSTK